jgi:hypothetical protein
MSLKAIVGLPDREAKGEKLAGKVPTLREVNLNYGALLDRQGALQNRVPALIAELRRLYPLLGSDGKKPIDESQRAEHQERVARIADLIGESAPDLPVEQPEGPRQKFARLDRELEDTRAAIEILGEKMRDEMMAASAVICRQLEARYHAIIRRLCVAFGEVHAAALEYHEFADALNREGVAWSRLHAMPPYFVGDPRDRQNVLAVYLRECVEYGLAPASILPTEFR